TNARRSSRLAMASSPGFARRCLLASPAALLASSLDFLQGTSEKIHLQGLFRQDPLQMVRLFAQRGGACVLPGCFHPGYLGIQFVAPPVKLPARDLQFSRQCHDIFAASQSLHRKLTELFRISSLCHSQFPFLQSVPSLTVSFSGFTPVSLDPNHPSLSTVSELPGSGAAHGVALVMDHNGAFL